MPINPDNILAHELIGLPVTIEKSTDPGFRGLTGHIRDETRNTLVLDTGEKLVRIAKAGTTLLATLPNRGVVSVEGNLLRHRPEERVKRGLSKW